MWYHFIDVSFSATENLECLGYWRKSLICFASPDVFVVTIKACSGRLGGEDGWCYNCNRVTLFFLIIQPFVKSLFSPTTGAPESGWARLSGLAVLNWVKQGHTVWFFWHTTTQDVRSEIVVGKYILGDGTALPALMIRESKTGSINACLLPFLWKESTFIAPYALQLKNCSTCFLNVVYFLWGVKSNYCIFQSIILFMYFCIIWGCNYYPCIMKAVFTLHSVTRVQAATFNAKSM